MVSPLLVTTLAAFASSTLADDCSVFGGDWVIPTRGLSGNIYPLTAGEEKGSFNISLDIRHGPTVGMGMILPNKSISMKLIQGSGNTTRIDAECIGNFNASGFNGTTCNQIIWDSVCISKTWCRAYTEGCPSPQPPYGEGFSFLSVFGHNMVLQRAPAKAAVYGITVGAATAVKVTVINNADGSSYSVDAEFNTTKQAVGPAFQANGIKPYNSWKAYLKPTEAGGDYTIVAACTGCTEDGSYEHVNISNVTFGDMWHCSGQSNMWLPVGNSFSQNDTIAAIKQGKYNNIRIMAGNSAAGVTNPWMTAAQAIVVPPQQGRYPSHAPILDFGAACWYFAQGLEDKFTAAGVKIPIGLSDTAIGGQRIEEYMVNDTTMYSCKDRVGSTSPEWNGRLYGQQTIPFVDMTIKGWVWYQGENNMGGVKGNQIAHEGYSCEQRALVQGWRKVWSEVPGTTDPMAPFGIVTLASSGSEGGPDMGAMRQAQTASWGVLPNPDMPNTFVAQAFDLDDKWGPGAGPCQQQSQWACCDYSWGIAGKCTYNKTSCAGREKLCAPACESTRTRSVMGGIHPRWKKPVGDRLATAAYNTVYGGAKAYTGPTLSGCTLSNASLIIQFNASLLRGDTLQIGKIPPPSSAALTGMVGGEMHSSGSSLYVQTNASLFCMEQRPALNATGGSMGFNYCPTWAGGTGQKIPGVPLDSAWIMLNYTKASDSTIAVDLTPLNGTMPTAVQYAWGVVDCCDHSDPNLYVTHPCGLCPIMSTSNLPANPFKAKIVGGKCECVAPQVCSE